MPVSDQPTLSIAIVSWQTRDFLLDCLRSIFSNPPQNSFEVIVVDNASTDGTADAVCSQFPDCILIANSSNAGYAAGNNQAIAKASGEFVLLLNPDVIIPAHGLDNAISFMQTHPDAGALGVRQVHPNGSLQRSVRGFPTPLSILSEILGLSRAFPASHIFGAYRMTYFGYDTVSEVDQPMGTFLLMRRKVIEMVGVLDEAFPIFFNEVDWCLRCKKAGWKIFFTPDIEIIHFGGASTTQVPIKMAWESRKSLLQYYAKHYASPVYIPLRIMIAAASWLYTALQARRRRV